MRTLIQRSSGAASLSRVPRTKQSVLTLIVAAALLIVAVLVAISQAGGSSGGDASGLSGVTRAQALFGGIPQQGIALGDPRAPVTLTEFADLQCPFCRQYTEAVLPTLVKRYVRTGKVRMVFRNLAFIGADSVRAARLAGAAGLQDRLWQFTDLVYRNQGVENSGYVTDAYLRNVARGAGLDVGQAFADATGAAVSGQLDAAVSQAQRFQINSTPSFVLTPAGGRPQRLSPSALTVDQFAHPIEAALGAG
jgi:protein-disulfide isomerase